MRFSGVSLLDMARPPDGYRTIASVATTYSADLVACLALLVALDGSGSDHLKYSKIEALRALERLRGRVRIVAQQNRVECHSGDLGRAGPQLLGLIDSILRTVPFDGRKRSFHPKVLIARQQSRGRPDRYILGVGSRNLTASSAWDFGIGLVGYARSKPPSGSRRLENVDQFIAGLGSLIADPALPNGFGDLANVTWEIPPELNSITFHFHSGQARAFKNTQLAGLPRKGKVLLISPFLTPSLVEELAAQFIDADEVRLVSGRTYLDQIAASKARTCFREEGGPIRAYSMLLAADDASPGLPDDEDAEQTSDDRGLHAKVFCVKTDSGCTALIGSANLTAHAWVGANWEAFVGLRSSGEFADELWNWSNLRAQPYRLPALNEVPAKSADSLDALRNELAELKLTLTDYDGKQPSRLESIQLGKLLNRHGCTLDVARFTTPALFVPWVVDTREVLLPACERSERTAFILMRARQGVLCANWIQCVEIVPPLSEDRDRQAFVRILGVDDFLRYLRALLDDPEPETDDGGGTRSSSGKRSQRLNDEDLFRLEDLLRRLNRDRDALKELNETITRYRDLFERSAIQPVEQERLRRFMLLWMAISDGMRMA